MGKWINRLKSEAGTNKVGEVLVVVVEVDTAGTEVQVPGAQVRLVLRGRPVDDSLQSCATSSAEFVLQTAVAHATRIVTI